MNDLHHRNGAAPRRSLARAVAGIVLAATCHVAPAQQEPAAADGVASSKLERAFWVCDYVATTRGIDATPIAHCSAVTDALKNRMFGGDFSELLAWWREHRHAEHAALARLER